MKFYLIYLQVEAEKKLQNKLDYETKREKRVQVPHIPLGVSTKFEDTVSNLFRRGEGFFFFFFFSEIFSKKEGK